MAERAALLARVVESEARASSRADLLDAVMEVMTDGVAVVEASGNVLMRNPVAERLAGSRRRPGREGEGEDHGFFRPDGSVAGRRRTSPPPAPCAERWSPRRTCCASTPRPASR